MTCSISNRCGVCGWELDEEGLCPGCGEQYQGAAQQDDSWGAPFNEITDEEDEEQDEEEDPDLEGFVVDSDEPM